MTKVMAVLTRKSDSPAPSTIHLRPTQRPNFFSEMIVTMAGCMPRKASWIHHRFSDHAVGFVAAGSGTYQADNGPVLPIESGGMFLVYPGPVFHYGPHAGTAWEEYHFGISGPGLQRWVDSGCFPKDGSVHQLTNIAPLIESFRELMRVLKRAEPGDADRAVPLAEGLLIEMYYSRVNLQHAQTPSKSMQSVLHYCQRHFAEEIDFTALAREQAMSYSSLRQSLRKITGSGPAHYQTRLRCDAAKTMLADTNLSVKEIAGRVGVPDQYTFSRVFKRCVGMSPQAYRQSLAPWSQKQ
jgi:AraC family transcriptional regulator, arabinose operon regulatory protein